LIGDNINLEFKRRARMKNIMALVFLFTPLMVYPATIGVPSQFMTIQEAIDAAEDGDTVLIADGTYSGPGNVKLSWDATQKHLVIKSENGPEACIIDGQDEYRGFMLYQGQDHRDVIEGLTITHGRAQTGITGPTRTIYTYDGGAIMLYYSSPQIRNCHLVENAVGASEEGPHLDDFFCNGGAIMCGTGSAPIIEDNLIRENYASQSGGGICFDDDAAGQVINNVIAHNHCRFRGQGGGISMVDHAHPQIMGNLIIHNTVLDYDEGGMGGAIYIYRSNPLLINNTIARNSAQNQFYMGEGGGIWINNEPYPVILNCILWENSSGSSSMNLYFPYLDKRLDFSYSLIEGGLGDIGVLKPYTVLDTPPSFADPENEDYRLRGNSPCRDTGDPDTTDLELPPYDLSGNHRLVGERIDMGAYEFAYPMGMGRLSTAGHPLQLYPNPSTGLLSILIQGSMPDGPYTIRITDLQGRIHQEWQSGKLPEQVQMKELPEGIYLISFYNPYGLFFNRKIIKE
jgi:hypothetical protein